MRHEGPLHRVACLAGAALLVSGAPAAFAPAIGEDAQRTPVEEEEADALHLLRRATYGPRGPDLERVLSMGIEGWLRWQMEPGEIDDSRLEARLARIDALSMTPADLLAAYPPPRVTRRLIEASGVDDADSLGPGERRRFARDLGLRPPARIAAELVYGRLLRAVHSERQLEAVMTDFWFDHFNVFWGKGPLRWMIADYERKAIRPHVFGRFEDMLRATATHPAMLVYLDNWRSAAPGSPVARVADRRGRGPTGLNENYARELLELHTLGVDGGYTQEDVVAVARAFTGWTIGAPGRGDRTVAAQEAPGALGFRFRPEMHDTGGKTVLGLALPEGRGVEDGLDVLRLLATHPSTARHVATRLVQAFVADDPPPALVDRLADVFLTTGGDLAAVTQALFGDPEFYAREHVLAKVKSPFRLVVSTLRATEAEAGPSRELLETLRSLEETPYLASAPTGYPEASDAWSSGGAMLQRMNFALDLARGEIQGVEIDPGSLVPGDAEDPVSAAVERLLPGVDAGRLVEVIRADLAAAPREPAEVSARAVGLILGGPEFQRH